MYPKGNLSWDLFQTAKAELVTFSVDKNEKAENSMHSVKTGLESDTTTYET